MSEASHIRILRDAIGEAARQVTGAEDIRVELTPPASADHGDLATPVAMTLAKAARRNPREIAGEIADRLREREDVIDVEVAGPGFINLRLSPRWFADSVADVVAAGEAYGADGAVPAERILLEYVSPNPTGPLHVGHARQAAYGDALGRILEFVGHTVTREAYVNDYGRQMEVFGAAVAAAYAELIGDEPVPPEDGYSGAYIAEVAARLHQEAGDRYRGQVSPPTGDTLDWFATRGGALMLADIQAVLGRARVRIDSYFSETTLHREGLVQKGVEALVQGGHAVEREGALWFRSSEFGDEKDRVLVRANGVTTYLAADVAYHANKADRGVDRLIDVLGADHHGYIARLKALLAATGHDPEMLEVMIQQLVSLQERGESKRMSKRAGTLVTMEELLDDIGVDALRFFLVDRSHDTALDLDLDLAREQSQENPVYYVQYAHARCVNILAKAAAAADVADPVTPPGDLDPSERELVTTLLAWPAAVAEAAARRSPHRVAAYLRDLARDLHAFYHRCRVVGEAPEVQVFRVALTTATRDVLKGGLALLAVTAPDRM